MPESWHNGYAINENDRYRGWLLGHFIHPEDPVRTTSAVEVKWGIHPAGQQRPEWTEGEERSTLLILVRRRVRLDLTGGTCTLEREGDYVTGGRG